MLLVLLLGGRRARLHQEWVDPKRRDERIEVKWECWHVGIHLHGRRLGSVLMAVMDGGTERRGRLGFVLESV